MVRHLRFAPDGARRIRRYRYYGGAVQDLLVEPPPEVRHVWPDTDIESPPAQPTTTQAVAPERLVGPAELVPVEVATPTSGGPSQGAATLRRQYMGSREETWVKKQEDRGFELAQLLTELGPTFIKSTY